MPNPSELERERLAKELEEYEFDSSKYTILNIKDPKIEQIKKLEWALWQIIEECPQTKASDIAQKALEELS